MKKGMIMGAIIGIAAFAEASCALGWKGGNSKAFVDADGNKMEDVANLVFVNLGSTINWDNAKVIEAADSTSVGYTTLKINSSGTVSGTVKWNWTSGSDENLVDNGDYLALMYQDETGLHKLSYYNDGELVEVGDEAVYLVDGIKNNSYSATSQYIGLTGDYTNVPEPTSGLLLLLGVAGLALRRRRA